MRAVVVTTVASTMLLFVGALSSACAPAPIGDYPDTETKLPDRKKTNDNGDNTTSSSSSSGNNGDNTPTATTPTTFSLNVTIKGPGTGDVTSTPAGLTCAAGACKGTFPKGTAVTLNAAPVSGSLFAGYTQGCTGDKCAPTLDADTDVTAEFQTLDGSWVGTYSNTRDAHNCTFKNAGNVTIAVASSGGAFTNAADVNGLELRQIPGCGLVQTTTGKSAPASVAIDGSKVTGTWLLTVQGASGNLDMPFTATITGKKMTGTWTCATCVGGFTITKQ